MPNNREAPDPGYFFSMREIDEAIYRSGLDQDAIQTFLEQLDEVAIVKEALERAARLPTIEQAKKVKGNHGLTRSN